MKNWFNEAKFGMFIHWGAYSVAARGEWILNRERTPYDEYIEKYVNQFKAEHYDPGKWAQLAKAAGMKYMVLTTKHHDGFCLWDTKTTDFNAVCRGPGRDLVAEYAEAARAAGLKVGFYFSLADWHHPDYPTPYARDWPEKWPDEEGRKRFVAFYREQLRELMTNYGKIDLLWYDGGEPGPLDGKEANEEVYRLQPDILINERNGAPFDFRCSEQSVTAPGQNVPWEACITLNGNWGYHRGDDCYKSAKEVIMLLIDTVKKGGNLLLNVGPKADGTIPEQSAKVLQEVGAWMEKNGEAIYGTTRTPFSWGNSYGITVKNNMIYILQFHAVDEFCIAEFKNRVKGIRRLADGCEMRYEQTDDGRLKIFDAEMKDIVGVYACEAEGIPEALADKGRFWIPGRID